MCEEVHFSKFAGLQAYSRQLYYQMNSVTGIFQQHFKPPMLPPCIDLSHPHQILNSPSPHVLNTCGKPCIPWMDLSKICDKIQFWSISVSLGSMYFFLFQSLYPLQKKLYGKYALSTL